MQHKFTHSTASIILNKTIIILAGLCFGLLAIISISTNFEETLSQRADSMSSTVSQIDNADSASEFSLAESKQVRYHNFLASYFLQESAYDRTNKTASESNDLWNGIINLPVTAVTKVYAYVRKN